MLYVNSSTFVPDDGSADLTLKPGDVVTLLGPRHLPLDSDGTIPDWTIFTGQRSTARARSQRTRRARSTHRSATSRSFLRPAKTRSCRNSRWSRLSPCRRTPYPRHADPSACANCINCYDRTATTVNANVGLAPPGMSVTEILGSGQAHRPNQNFTLKQSPLTFMQAADRRPGRQARWR